MLLASAALRNQFAPLRISLPRSKIMPKTLAMLSILASMRRWRYSKLPTSDFFETGDTPSAGFDVAALGDDMGSLTSGSGWVPIPPPVSGAMALFDAFTTGCAGFV